MTDRRFSLPMSSNKENHMSAKFSFTSHKPNRRHTLLPTRGILKASTAYNSEDNDQRANHTIAIIPGSRVEKRRVSFAPEVTLHKINHYPRSTSGARLTRTNTPPQNLSGLRGAGCGIEKARRRDSLQFVIPSFSKHGENDDEDDSESEYSQPIVPLLKQAYGHEFGVNDDDNTTQTISMELTDQINRQQVEISQQQQTDQLQQIPPLGDQHQEDEDDDNDNDDLKLGDVFAEDKDETTEVRKQVEPITKVTQQELDESDVITPNKDEDLQITLDEDEYSMDLTKTFQKITISTEDKCNTTSKTADITQDVTNMDFTEIKRTQVQRTQDLVQDSSEGDKEEEEEEELMEFTQPVKHTAAEPSSISNEVNDTLPEGQGVEDADDMEFTERFKPTPLSDINEDGESEQDDFQDAETMEFTQIQSKVATVSVTSTTNDTQEEEEEEEEEMEFTQQQRLTTKVTSPPPLPEEHNKVPGTPSPSLKRIRTAEDGSPQSSTKSNKRLQLDSVQVNNISEALQNTSVDLEAAAKSISKADEHRDVNDSVYADHSMNSSYTTEPVVSTELIPLAETTINSGDEEYEEEEQEEEEEEDDDDYNNVSLQAFLDHVQVQFYDMIGPSERELVLDSYDADNKPSFIEYVDVVNSIPDFRYFDHLIKQYKSSIENIRSIVSDFESSVLENNPTSIREYFEQSEELRRDLKINYQALASYARKQAKNENLNFLINLLKQLKKSYQNTNDLLDSQLSETLELRKNLLMERQQLIERKLEIKRRLNSLNNQECDFDKISPSKLDQLRQKLLDAVQKNKQLKHDLVSKADEVKQAKVILSEKENESNRLSSEFKNLQDEICKNKLPDRNDIQLLKNQFNGLEVASGLKLVELDSHVFKLKIHDELELTLNLDTKVPSLRFLRTKTHNDQFKFVYKKFESSLIGLKCDSTIRDYINELILIYKNFKNLINELKVFKLLYQMKISEDRITSVYYKPNSFKFSMSLDLKDLMNDDDDYIKVSQSKLIGLAKDGCVIDVNEVLKEIKLKSASLKVGFIDRVVL